MPFSQSGLKLSPVERARAMSRRRWLLFMLLLAAGWIAPACTGINLLTPLDIQPTVGIETRPPPPAVRESTLPALGSGVAVSYYPLNEYFTQAEITLVIMGWGQPAVGAEAQPDPGQKFVMVDLVLKNEGEDILVVAPEVQMTLQDARGTTYPVESRFRYSRGVAHPFQEGVLPGEHVRGQIMFQVPQDSYEFTFIYNPQPWWQAAPFVVMLPASAAAESLPAGLFSIRAETHAVGEVVTLGGQLSFVVNGMEVERPAAAEDFRYVILDLEVVNLGRQTLTDSSWRVGLRDITGQQYELDSSPLLHANTIGINPLPLVPMNLAGGERVRGEVSFKVSPDAEELIFLLGITNPASFNSWLERAVVSLGEWPQPQGPPVSLPGAQAPVAVPKGVTAQVDALAVTVTQVAYPQETQWGRAAPGSKWVTVQLMVENNQSTSAEFPSQDGLLKDQIGRYYSLAAFKLGTDSGGPLFPGESVEALLEFMVPLQSRELYLVYPTREHQKVFFALQP